MLHTQAPKHKVQDVSSWMTGIQEVPLPMAYKLRNIEDTEAAKKRLLATSAAATSQCADRARQCGVKWLLKSRVWAGGASRRHCQGPALDCCLF